MEGRKRMDAHGRGSGAVGQCPVRVGETLSLSLSLSLSHTHTHTHRSHTPLSSYFAVGFAHNDLVREKLRKIRRVYPFGCNG